MLIVTTNPPEALVGTGTGGFISAAGLNSTLAVKISALAEIENANSISARSEAVNPTVLLIVFFLS
jgi:hypothetical protein